jgi:hypothetical protein
MMDTNHPAVGISSPSDRMSVIRQLVSQQFFLPPNFVIDRTHRIELLVHGSDRVFDMFSDFLYEISKSVKGNNINSYSSALKAAAKRLNLDELSIEGIFYKKSNGFLKEGLATEEILFITTIATILESLDLIHYDLFIHELRSRYNDLNKQEDSFTKNSKFEKGVERLGEVADSLFSLLLNLRKIKELATIFQFSLNYDQHQVEVYYKEVIASIMNTNS